MNDKDIVPVEINTDIIKNANWEKLHEATWEDLVQMGHDVGVVKIYAQWVLGMLGHVVMRKYGDLKKYAAATRQNYDSLRQYVFIYRRYTTEDSNFHPSKYYGSVPWGVMAIAATSSRTPQRLIDKLQNENKEVSIKVAYSEIKRLQSQTEVPPIKKKNYKLVWDNEAELWETVYNPDYYPGIRKPSIKYKFDKNTQLWDVIFDPKDYPILDFSELKKQLQTYEDKNKK